jgi:DNA-directed RNA polymerase subunit RPC12/RpoP
MPMIRYLCTNDQCGKSNSKLFRSGNQVEQEIQCKECGGKARRTLSSPASSSKIVIDNGVQARAVEINPNIMEINSERARKPTDRGD